MPAMLSGGCQHKSIAPKGAPAHKLPSSLRHEPDRLPTARRQLQRQRVGAGHRALFDHDVLRRGLPVRLVSLRAMVT